MVTGICYPNKSRAQHDRNLNESLIDLRNPIISKEIPENENPIKNSILLEKSSTLISNKKVKDFLQI